MILGLLPLAWIASSFWVVWKVIKKEVPSWMILLLAWYDYLIILILGF